MISPRTLAAALLCLALTPAYGKPAQQPVHKTAHHPAHHKAAAKPKDRMFASVYWEGKRVATGRKFDPNGMTVAHKNLPFGTRLMVSYGRNAAEVVVNDRGPYVAGRDIDLTRGVARALHFPGLGKVRWVYWPPLPRARPEKLVSKAD